VFYRLKDRRVKQMLRMAEQFLDEHAESVEMCQIIDEGGGCVDD